jgi:hypothetical protein
VIEASCDWWFLLQGTRSVTLSIFVSTVALSRARVTVADLCKSDSGLADNLDIPETSLNYKHCILSCPSFSPKSCACTLDQDPSTAVFASKSLRCPGVFGGIVTKCPSVVAADRLSTAVLSVCWLALGVASSCSQGRLLSSPWLLVRSAIDEVCLLFGVVPPLRLSCDLLLFLPCALLLRAICAIVPEQLAVARLGLCI